MILKIRENMSVDDISVIIECNCVDSEVRKIYDYINQYNILIEAIQEGKRYQIPINEIIYIESVDKKTFIYCDKAVYQCKKSMAFLEKDLKNTPIVRVSKNCLINGSYLKSVEPYVNHRLKAEMNTGEYIIISRKYMDKLKEKLVNVK